MIKRESLIKSICAAALTSAMLTGGVVLPHPTHLIQCLHLDIVASAATKKYPKSGVLDLTKPITISDMNTGKNYTLDRGQKVKYTCNHGVIRIKPLSDHYAVNGSSAKFFNSGYTHKDGDGWVTANGRRVHHSSGDASDSNTSAHHPSTSRRAKALRAKRKARRRAKLHKERKLKAERVKKARTRRAAERRKSQRNHHKVRSKDRSGKKTAHKQPKQTNNYKKRGAVKPTSQHPGSTSANEKLPRTSEAAPSRKTTAEAGMTMAAALAAELASPFRSLKKDTDKH